MGVPGGTDLRIEARPAGEVDARLSCWMNGWQVLSEYEIVP